MWRPELQLAVLVRAMTPAMAKRNTSAKRKARRDAMTEPELQALILCGKAGYVDVDGLLSVDCSGECLAHLYGWKGLHVGPLKTSHGWRTPTRGDLGDGWPDLMLARPGRLIAAELKRETGDLTDSQMAVLALLRSAGVDTYVWRPSNWDDGSIMRALSS